MGKKRRMLSATKKFAKKHSQHPRMRMLNSRNTATTTAPVEEVVLSTPEPVKLAPEPTTTPATPIMAPKATPAPAPTVSETIEAKAATITPKKTKLKAPKKAAPKTAKKTSTRRRKTAKKKTNNATA